MLYRTVLALTAAVALAACSDGGTTITTGGGNAAAGGGDAGSQQAAGTYAIPQEVLRLDKEAIKVTGTITVKDFDSGYLQIDVTLPVEGSAAPPQGVAPITVARYNAPGPYELFLPPKTKEANIALILDLKKDGPGAEDPRTVYSGNPLKLSGQTVTGIDLTVDKTPGSLPPTPPPAAGSGTGTAPPAPDALSMTTAAAGNGSGAAPATTAPTGSAAGTGVPAAPTGTGAPAATTGAKGSTTAPATGAAAPVPPPAAAATNPPGVTAAPVKGAGTGKTAIDVLDEALDGAPKSAKPGP